MLTPLQRLSAAVLCSNFNLKIFQNYFKRMRYLKLKIHTVGVLLSDFCYLLTSGIPEVPKRLSAER
jgi:hypothetical protein